MDKWLTMIAVVTVTCLIGDPASAQWTATYTPYTYPHPLSTSTIPSCTVTQSTNTQAAFQTAVNAAISGSVLCLAAGTTTLTSNIAIGFGITLRGSSACTLGTVNNVSNVCVSESSTLNASSSDILTFTGDNTNLRLTNFAITGSNTAYAITIQGRFPLAGVHIDHMMFTNLGARAFLFGMADPIAMNVNGAITGSLDHLNYFSNVVGNGTTTFPTPFIEFYGDSITEWNSADNWGSNNFMYLEDSSLEWSPGATQPSANMGVFDSEGGRVVVRHNTIVNGFLSAHDTGAIAVRGTRVREAYSNTFICGQGYTGFDCGNSPMSFRGGSLMFYDNSLPLCTTCTALPRGWESPTENEVWRVDGTPGTSSFWPFKCTAAQGTSANNTASDFSPHCSQTPFARCGDVGVTNGTCVGASNTCTGPSSSLTNPGAGNTILTRIDGGSGVLNGTYPCRDQTGRGRDSADHTTQALLPSYYWNNTDPNNGNVQLNTLQNTGGTLVPTYVAANRDVFLTDTAGFCTPAGAACTKGVGRGTLAQRPATCSNTDFPGSYPGPAYFATDTNTLYTCAAVVSSAGLVVDTVTVGSSPQYLNAPLRAMVAFCRLEGNQVRYDLAGLQASTTVGFLWNVGEEKTIQNTAQIPNAVQTFNAVTTGGAATLVCKFTGVTP